MLCEKEDFDVDYFAPVYLSFSDEPDKIFLSLIFNSDRNNKK